MKKFFLIYCVLGLTFLSSCSKTPEVQPAIDYMDSVLVELCQDNPYWSYTGYTKETNRIIFTEETVLSIDQDKNEFWHYTWACRFFYDGGQEAAKLFSDNSYDVVFRIIQSDTKEAMDIVYTADEMKQMVGQSLYEYVQSIKAEY